MLCRELGVIHPDELLERLTLRQFIEWRQEYKRRPFGDRREDFRLAVLAIYMAKLCAGAKVELPELTWPYFPDGEDIEEQAAQFFAAIEDEKNGK